MNNIADSRFDTIKFPFIDAPNLALPIMAVLKSAELLGNLLKKIGIDERKLEESHQKWKKTAPKTACEIGECFQISRNEIKSERRPFFQWLFFRVPFKYLDGHAVHKVLLKSCGMELGLFTRVLGRSAYGEGLVVLIKKIIEMGNGLKPGYHRAQDIIFDD
jgi:4-hydroxy-tetrahydrodipicolinate reductase